MNNVTLQGRLVREPEIKIGKNETKIARYTLAVPRKYQKESEQIADFLNCICFGKTADFAEKYLNKGEQILIRGRLQSGSYESETKGKVYTTDVIIEEHYFCGGNSKNDK